MKYRQQSTQSQVKDTTRHPVSTTTYRAFGVAGLAFAVLAAATLTGCSTKIIKHGHLHSQTELQKVQAGMTSDQVRMSLGSPATTATVGEGKAYYYVSSTNRESVLGGSKEIDRRVTAVYFSETGAVQRVASYGLKEGKVFDFISRTTPSAASGDKGILNGLFRNLGQKTFGFGDE